MTKPVEIQDIRNACHTFAINHAADALWMDEFCIGGRRLDVLTIDLKSWEVKGFEIKMSREDFRKDDKWQEYLPYVNRMYFAAPRGIIKASELPPEIGLLEFERGEYRGVSANVTRRAGRLQPGFVRQTFTEQHMVRLLVDYMRNVNWREERRHAYCQDCGKQMAVVDGRRTGSMSVVVG